VAGKEARELSDDDIVGVLSTEAKKRREASAAFADAGRAELADRRDRATGVSRERQDAGQAAGVIGLVGFREG